MRGWLGVRLFLFGVRSSEFGVRSSEVRFLIQTCEDIRLIDRSNCSLQILMSGLCKNIKKSKVA